MQKIFKLFSQIPSYLWTSKKSLILIVGVALLFTFLPTHSANAADIFGFGDVVNAIKRLFLTIPTLIIVIPLYFIAFLLGSVLSVVSSIMVIFINGAMAIKVVPMGTGPEIVQAGWAISQNIANLFFIIILVFIGLATILRLEKYQYKKILPSLIIVALLINFSGVLVGFITDIGNIFTNYFISRCSNFNGLLIGLGEIGTNAWEMITSWDKDIVTQSLSLISKCVVLILYYLIAIFITFTVMLLFFVRTLVLWVVAMLAPIAFAFYILPATRKYWSQWWEQLIQWSIIGIPISFFLFISNKLLVTGSKDIDTIATTFTTNNTDPVAAVIGELMSSMLSNFVVLFLLMIGLGISITMAPAGAKGIINFGKNAPKKLANSRLGGKVLGKLAGGTQKGLAGTTKFLQNLETKAANSKLAKSGWLGKGITAVGTGMLIAPTRFTTQGINKLTGAKLIEFSGQKRKISENELKKIDGMTTIDAEAYINNVATGKDKLQYQARMAEKGTLEFASQKFKNEAKAARKDIFIKENPYYQKEAGELAKSLGDMDEDELVYSKLIGMPNKTPDNIKARNEKKAEVREEIKTTKDIIEKRVGIDDYIIEVGLKLEYITKDDVKNNRQAAIAKVRSTSKDLEQDLRDEAATAMYVKDFKPEDVKKIIDPNTLAHRVGLTLGNAKNIQKIQDIFGRKKFDSVIKGIGGLDSATNTSSKLDEFAKINPALHKAIFNSPAFKEMDLAALNNMLDVNGQKTSQYKIYEKRLRVQDALSNLSPAEKPIERYNKLKDSRNKLEQDIVDYEKRIIGLKLRKQPTTVWDNKLKSTRKRSDEVKKRSEKVFDYNISPDPQLRRKYEEIERLKK